MSAFSRLAAFLRSVPSSGARYLDNRLAAIEDSIAGLASDGTFTMSSAAAYKVVYVSAADTVALADADASGKKMPMGITASAPTGSTAVVRFIGILTGAGSFTAGALQYVSTTAGDLTETAPSAPNATPIAIAINTTDLLVLGPLGAVFDTLRSVAANLGSYLVGYQDVNSKTAAANVGAALDEIYVDRLSTQRGVPIKLGEWREVSATGDVGNVAAIGGVLASDTAPILRAEATTNSWEISWATGNVDPIGVQLMLPPDLDDTASAFLDLIVYSGTTDAATMGVATSWNGGSEVTDSADDSGTKSATRHTITATIAAADIPASSTHVTIRLTPPTHATNAIQLVGAILRYTPKLITS